MSVIDHLLQNDNVRLPTPPAIAIHILEEINSAEPSFSRLSKLISSDGALTARVLRIANSPILAPLSPIDSLDKALTRMGLSLITNIALSFVLVDNFRHKAINDFNFDYFWKRAVTAAVVANVLSSTIKRPNDNIFIAALLQDIGILVAYTSLPSCQQKLGTMLAGESDIKQATHDCTGCSHPQFGSELLSCWGLPESICQPILFHHQPELAAKAYRGPARIINLADKLSAALNDPRHTEKLREFRSEAIHYYDLSGNKISQIIEKSSEISIEILSLLNISSKNLEKSNIQLLQEANEALCKIGMSTSKLLNQYKHEKELAQKASSALSEANAELSRLAFQDSLTGLYNLRYFHDYLDRELQRASRYDTTFAFLMFDLDDFKLINDTHGHQAGDKMLEKVAQITLQTVRNTDLVARYGGEEFAIILPETTLDVAQQIAERLRENIAELEIDWKGKQLKVTASIGVSYFNSKNGNLSKNQIIAIADAGLYRAKSEGKNRVSLPV